MGLLAVIGYIALNFSVIAAVGTRKYGGFAAWWRS
jgi:hypothetical protein